MPVTKGSQNNVRISKCEGNVWNSSKASTAKACTCIHGGTTQTQNISSFSFYFLHFSTFFIIFHIFVYFSPCFFIFIVFVIFHFFFFHFSVLFIFLDFVHFSQFSFIFSIFFHCSSFVGGFYGAQTILLRCLTIDFRALMSVDGCSST